jgi:hypothetical protein
MSCPALCHILPDLQRYTPPPPVLCHILPYLWQKNLLSLPSPFPRETSEVSAPHTPRRRHFPLIYRRSIRVSFQQKPPPPQGIRGVTAVDSKHAILQKSCPCNCRICSSLCNKRKTTKNRHSLSSFSSPSLCLCVFEALCCAFVFCLSLSPKSSVLSFIFSLFHSVLCTMYFELSLTGYCSITHRIIV